MQRILDCLLELRRSTEAAFVFALLRCCGFEYSYSGVRLGRSEVPGRAPLNLDTTGDLERVLTVVQALFESELRRRVAVYEKYKVLLTLCSVVLTLLGVAVFSSPAASSPWTRVACACSVALLTSAIAVLLAAYDVHADMGIDISQQEVSLRQDDLAKSLINSYIAATSSLEQRNSFIVDLYRVARTCFTVALLLAAALALTYVLGPRRMLH